MTAPRFDPRTDAEPAVRAGWLRPGEQLVGTRFAFRVTFEVPGRGGNGKVLKQSPWRTVGRRALAVADGAVTVLDFFASDTLTDPARPQVRVFGTHVDCQAAVSTESHTDRSFWVLTDHRFGYLRGEDGGGLSTVWELPVGGFGYTEFRKRRITYERFTFGDGSLIDFRRA